MIRKSRFLSISLILLMLLGLLAGCANTSSSHSLTGDLTANQAAQIVYDDLAYHGIIVEKVNITGLTFTNATTAKAGVTYVTSDGKTVNENVSFEKEGDQWHISGHRH